MSAARTQPRGRGAALRRTGIELAILVVAALVVAGALLLAGPSLLGGSAKRAHNADRTLLQKAVDVYRQGNPTGRPWPTLSGVTGQAFEGAIAGYQCDASDSAEVCSWVDMELLEVAGLLASSEIVTSADTSLNVTAGNAPSGRYGWFVDGEGRVQSSPEFSRETGYP